MRLEKFAWQYFTKLIAFIFSIGILGCSTSEKVVSQASLVKKQLHPDRKILIVGHRGASGYRPEHTLASYKLAIALGADFIEPDLVMTKDGVLIARHENEISETTDVAQKFPNRKRTKAIDGLEVSGWFTEDFTLKEIKTLRAKERLSTRDQFYNGQYEIPTFAEVLQLAQKRGQELGRTIGVYPETKHPSYFESIHLPLEPALVADLKRANWVNAEDPVLIQSFELTSLRKLKSLIGCRLIFLYSDPASRPFDGALAQDPKTYGDYTSLEELKKLSLFIYGIGPSKRLILPVNAQGQLTQPTSLVADAHQAGLVVHPYTFRSDEPFLAPEYTNDPSKEYRQFFDLGVDGLFSDFPNHAAHARAEFEANSESVKNHR